MAQVQWTFFLSRLNETNEKLTGAIYESQGMLSISEYHSLEYYD